MFRWDGFEYRKQCGRGMCIIVGFALSRVVKHGYIMPKHRLESAHLILPINFLNLSFTKDLVDSRCGIYSIDISS